MAKFQLNQRILGAQKRSLLVGTLGLVIIVVMVFTLLSDGRAKSQTPQPALLMNPLMRLMQKARSRLSKRN